MVEWYVGTTGATISGTDASQSTVADTSIDPFSSVIITDPNIDAIDTLTITLTGAGGTLTDGVGFAGLTSLGGVYTLIGSAATITSELDALIFKPTAGAPNTSSSTGFTLSVASSGYGTTTYASSPTTLFSFSGASAIGANPVSGLITDAAGDLFGTTENGGSSNLGGVFELVKNGSGYTQNTLFSFNDALGPAHPVGGLIANAAGDLFGTTEFGGANHAGTVFELVNTGSGYSLTTIASFTSSNGANPVAGLVADAAGNLFGTTEFGGANNAGTIFEIKNSGTAASPIYSGAPTVLYDFTGGDDGANPVAGLTIDANGNLLGTVANGGAGDYPDGAVFELANNGGNYSFKTLVAFNGAGAITNSGHDPVANLITDSAGDLFGTTELGGQNGFGEVFEIKNDGTPAAPNYAGAATDLYDFTKGSDGAEPAAGLIIDSAGNLFGTTTIGGANSDGTAFELVNGSSGYTLETIASFNDVNNAYSGLVADATGNLFGTLSFGANTPGGSGSVYEIAGVFNAIPTTDNTTRVTDTDPAVAPTISGTHTATTTSEAAVMPFSGVTIADANANGSETLTITLSNGGAGGALSGAGLSGGTGGVYTLSGSAAAVTSALDALTFTPTAGQANTQAMTTFTLSDVSTAFGTATVDSATTVTDTDPAVAPTISGTHTATTTSEAAVMPFSGVTIADANANGSETLTITLSNGGAGGALSGAGLSGGTGGVYTLSGSAAAVTSALDALTFTPTAGQANTQAMTTFTLSDVSTAFGTATVDSATTVTDTDPAVAPTISGTHTATTTSEAAVMPFSGVTIADANANGSETLTITLSNGGAGGALSGAGLSGGAGGVYTLSGSAAAATISLDALLFTPTAGQANTQTTTTFTLSDLSNAFGTATVDSATRVTDTDPAVAPTISGTHTATTISEAPVKPFSGVTIADANNGGANVDALTITLSGGGALSGAGNPTAGVYTLTGTAAQLTAALQAVAFTPVDGVANTAVTTGFTLNVADAAVGKSASDSATTVTDADPAVTPTGTGAATATSYATTGVGQTLVFTLSTSATLNITAGAALTLSNGGTAVYAAGTGTTAATFDYTPTVGQNVANISVTGYSGTMSYTGGAALGAITNASDAVTLTAGAATAGSGEMTIGGNGATGAIISVQAYNDALTLQASSRAVVTGSGDTLTVGANVNFNVVGSNNTIAAGSGAVGLISGTGNVVTSSNETFYASSGVSATINGAANTFYATSGSDALTVNGSGSAGDYFAANNDTITFASGPGGYIVGAGDTIAASTGSIELTVGGNGAVGVLNNVNGSNDTVNLLANSRESVTGSGDAISVGANVNFNVVGSNNTVVAGSGAVGLISGTGNVFTSSNETFYASSGVSATINGAANTFYATSGSDALTVNGSGSAGDYFAANNDSITFASGPGGYIVGAGDTIAASTGSIEVTVGGNGAGGVTNNVNGSNDTVNLLANSRELVTGSGDAISVGANVNFSVVGSNNTITASDGVGSLIRGTGDTLALQAGAIGNTVYVDASTTQATIQNFGLGRTDVLDLLNGAGGYASAASVVSGLASDGHGGTLLSLGAGGSIDFVGVATGTLTAASFKIG